TAIGFFTTALATDASDVSHPPHPYSALPTHPIDPAHQTRPVFLIVPLHATHTGDIPEHTGLY
ncbi:hypothetical protein DL89DRAFT_265764, partial [Linderina pennispora]